MNPDAEIKDTINRYYEYRKYLEPTDIEAFLWLVAEVREVALLLPRQESFEMEYALNRTVSAGEHAEAALRQKNGWVRNNPIFRPRNPEDLKGEIADCLMMLYKFAEKSGIDPYEALLAKMKEKGFTP